MKDIELDEEQKQQYISGLKRNDETSKEDKSFSHEAKKQDNNGGMVISIKGGIPNQGLYTPHLNMQFSFYEPRSKRGAEGTVYQTNYGDYVVKIYHQKANTVERREKLNKMLEYSINKEFICWPEDILLTSADGEFIGFVMKQVKNPISLYEKIEELDLLSKDVKSRDNVSRLFLMDYCKRIAEQFFELHRHDILVGDVNESNILISKNDDEIYFVDTDSYQFDSYYSNVGQEMYTSPEYIERNSIEGELRYDSPKEYNDELFAMAVMFYRILFLGASPYKMQNGHVAAAILDREFDFFVSDTEVDESSFETLRESLVWNQTPTCIRELFVKTFRKSSRFKAEEWIDAIHMAENEIASGLYSNELIPGIKEYDKKPKNIEGNEAVEENNKQENELPQETKQVNEPVQPVQPVQPAKKPVPTTAKKKFVVTIPKIGQGSGNTQTTVSGQTNSGGIISIPKSPVLSNASNTSNTASRPAEKILAPENLSQKKNIQVTIPKIPNLPGRPGPKK